MLSRPKNSEKLVKILKSMVHDHGTQAGVARYLDVTPTYISDVLSGKRHISETLASKLGFKLVSEWKKG